MSKGRKGTMMVALVALLVAIFATAAYAATIECPGGRCNGTGDPDILSEPSGPVNDQMYGYGGEDELYAYQELLNVDTDKLYGGGRSDYLVSDDGDGNDLVVGGKGQDDQCFVDAGDEVRSCDGNVFRDVP